MSCFSSLKLKHPQDMLGAPETSVIPDQEPPTSQVKQRMFFVLCPGEADAADPVQASGSVEAGYTSVTLGCLNSATDWSGLKQETYHLIVPGLKVQVRGLRRALAPLNAARKALPVPPLSLLLQPQCSQPTDPRTQPSAFSRCPSHQHLTSVCTDCPFKKDSIP